MTHKLRSLPGKFALLMIALVSIIAGCVPGGGTELSPLRIIVPTPPGGGFDQTARLTGIALEDERLVESASIINMPGDGGLAALHRARFEEGAPSLLLQMGLATIANAEVSGQGEVLRELTPIAQLMDEPGAILVRPDSEFATIDDLVAAVRAEPDAAQIGGGSQPGGPDYLAAMLFLEAIGVEPSQSGYRAYDGGGDMLGALVSDQVDVAFTGISEHLYEIRDGEVRVLAITGAERLPGIDAPTLMERGLDVEFHNWRGLMAPPGISPSERDALVDMFASLAGSATWGRTVRDNHWNNTFVAGDDFADHIDRETRELHELLRRFPVGG
ncbi:Bug family tripartite tricarboxylate transporter substrate binding protein [Hoyosella subflava]|uniref:Secreted protein n=1 Tax=Hoyosella subflava (strain DSM 45089 / JCM 17490 / NBRC 109087 / DQS3-9A1) TaxID=443218 RepID=F6ENQ5_HOYSD|nr:tripartite tricarboxylate transporter substrate-binding protein [Hoyosella subflava]AEF42912.1 secreted protein [Hoyosella subflava DQS3-9A1]